MTTKTIVPSSWVEIASEEYGFKAAFPRAPREEPLPELAPGTNIRRWTARGTEDGATHIFVDQRPLVTMVACAMSEALWSQCAGFEVASAIGNAVLSSQVLGASRVLWSEEVHLAGLRGWAVIASVSDSKGEFLLESRTIASRPHIYQLGVKVPARWGAAAASRYAARYFDSFELPSPAESG